MFIAKALDKVNKGLNKGYEAEKCDVCSAKFNLVVRIHKCKRCLRFVCSGCGKHRSVFITSTGEESQKHRICVLCMEDILFIHEKIGSYEMAWGITSNFARQWLSKLQSVHPKSTENRQQHYDNFLRLFHHNRIHYQQAYETIEKDVMMGRTDLTVFNYSMRELLYRVQKNRNRDSTRRSMANVLSSVTAKYNDLGYCQGMSNVSAFLLCFGSQIDAFVMYCDLIEHILPEGLYLKSAKGTNLIGLLANLAFLKEYFIILLTDRGRTLTEQEIEIFQTVIEIIGAKCLLTLFVGNLSFINLMFVWKELMRTRSFEVIQRVLLAIVYLVQDQIIESTSRYKLIERFVQMVQNSQLRQAYEEIQIDQKKRKQIIDRFYDGFAKQWKGKDKTTLRKLERMSKFNEQELEKIQAKFITVTAQKGMKIDHFCNFIEQFMKKGGTIRFVEQFDKTYFQRIYQSYDKDANGLDFRQFICCLSSLVRGNLRDRISMLAESLRMEDGYVSSQVFSNNIQGLIKLMHKVVPYDEQLTELESVFLMKARSYYFQQNRISSSQVSVLINDTFVNQATLRCILENDERTIELILESL